MANFEEEYLSDLEEDILNELDALDYVDDFNMDFGEIDVDLVDKEYVEKVVDAVEPIARSIPDNNASSSKSKTSKGKEKKTKLGTKVDRNVNLNIK